MSGTEKIVHLNVGGQIFSTTTTTLLMDRNSVLATMFGERGKLYRPNLDEQGRHFIDRDPKYFAPILNFLRTNKVIVDEGVSLDGVLEEAKYFNVQPMVEALERILHPLKPPSEFTRHQFITILAHASGQEVRFTGTNLSGLNLSKLDISNVHLKNCDLSNADLSEAICISTNFTKASLVGANLQKANLHLANLTGADLTRADLTEARFRDAELLGADLNDTKLTNANFYHANCRNAVLSPENRLLAEATGGIMD